MINSHGRGCVRHVNCNSTALHAAALNLGRNLRGDVHELKLFFCSDANCLAQGHTIYYQLRPLAYAR